MLLIAIIAFIAGFALIARGRRGRAIDDHPVCRRCGFDLSGRAPGSHACPECGTVLSSMAIEIGNRRPRASLIATGAILLLISLGLVGMITPSVRNFDTSRFKPDWWLIHDARIENSLYYAKPNTDQLLIRVKAGAVSQSSRDKIVTIALALQADRQTPWNPAWGDMIECFKNNGQLPAADWQTYLAHNEFVTMEVRANCARGDRIPFTLTGELRGGTPIKPGRSGNGIFARYTGGVPGVLSYVDWGGTAGSTIQTDGTVHLPAQSWPLLKPGPHTISITMSGLGGYDEKNPAYFANLTCQGNWTLLPDGQQSVQLYHDEAAAQMIQNRLRYSLTTCNTGDFAIQINCDHPPTDLFMDVFLHSGSSQWKSDFPLMVSPTQWPFGSVFVFSNTAQLAGQHVDVVLRPSIEAASNTMKIDRLLDHEFVYRYVLFPAKR